MGVQGQLQWTGIHTNPSTIWHCHTIWLSQWFPRWMVAPQNRAARRHNHFRPIQQLEMELAQFLWWLHRKRKLCRLAEPVNHSSCKNMESLKKEHQKDRNSTIRNFCLFDTCIILSTQDFARNLQEVHSWNALFSGLLSVFLFLQKWYILLADYKLSSSSSKTSKKRTKKIPKILFKKSPAALHFISSCF